jgi:hypothetical protein
MDVTLQKYPLFDLPSQLRVGAIVHDGAADLRLWPGPGPDTELRAVWGDGLQEALDTELKVSSGKRLELGQCLRIGRGALHCDLLVWVATREPEPGTDRSAAPNEAAIREAVRKVLLFVAERGVERVAFEALGHGADEVARVERILAIAKAAQEYQDVCRRDGKAPIVEELIICEPDAKLFSLARSRLGSLARAVEPPKPKAEPKKAARVRGESKTGSSKRGAPRLTPEEVEKRRLSSAPYSMRGRYIAGDFLLHARFGVGRVEQVVPEGAVLVLFEDGEIRKMVHGRAS